MAGVIARRPSQSELPRGGLDMLACCAPTRKAPVSALPSLPRARHLSEDRLVDAEAEQLSRCSLGHDRIWGAPSYTALSICLLVRQPISALNLRAERPGSCWSENAHLTATVRLVCAGATRHAQRTSSAIRSRARVDRHLHHGRATPVALGGAGRACTRSETGHRLA